MAVLRLTAALACTLLACAGRALGAAPVPVVLVTAQQIALYGDRSLLVCDGGVSVRWTGMQITATRAAYDLRSNRLVASGSVTVVSRGVTSASAGYAYDFSHMRGGPVANPDVPQLSPIDATAIGQQVELRPATSITFTVAQVRSGAAFTSVASYTYAIPPPAAKDFGYSPVPAAALEWATLLKSSKNGYAFGRLRFDRYNGGPGAGLEEHYARSDRGYVAVGQTLDADGGRFDLTAFERIAGSLSQSLTGSKLAGNAYVRYALNASSRKGFASLSFAQSNGTRSDDLYLSGVQHAIGHAGSVRLQVDAGHDVHPFDARIAQDYRITPGVHVDTATARFGAASLSGSFDLGESIYDYGRGTLASALSFWGTFPVSARLQFNGGASFSHDAPPFPATSRTYTAGMTLHAGERFNLVTSFTYAHDDGQYAGFGRPEYSAAFDVRVRRKNGTGIEIGTILPFGPLGNKTRAAVFNLQFLK